MKSGDVARALELVEEIEETYEGLSDDQPDLLSFVVRKRGNDGVDLMKF